MRSVMIRLGAATLVMGLTLGGTAPVGASVVLDFTGGGVSGTGGGTQVEGYTFSVSIPITVSGLAMWNELGGSGMGVPGSYPVGLWDSTGALLASTTISGLGQTHEPSTGFQGASTWDENAITPLTLVPGQTYTLGALYFTGSAVTAVNTATITAVPGVTYIAPKLTVSNSLVEPTGPAANGIFNGYFGPNLVLAPVASVPEPGSLTLCATALATALGWTWTRRHGR